MRHAARSLEALTAFKAARALMARSESLAAAQLGPGDGAAAEEDASARRYARLLISEIKLYHETVVVAGRRDRDLGARLSGEIARARALYEQRVPADRASARRLFSRRTGAHPRRRRRQPARIGKLIYNLEFGNSRLTMNRKGLFALAFGAALLVPAVAPRAQQAPAPGDATEPVLRPTNHPRLPADLSQLWLAPVKARTVRTVAMNDFATAVKLEVDTNFAGRAADSVAARRSAGHAWAATRSITKVWPNCAWGVLRMRAARSRRSGTGIRSATWLKPRRYAKPNATRRWATRQRRWTFTPDSPP